MIQAVHDTPRDFTWQSHLKVESAVRQTRFFDNKIWHEGEGLRIVRMATLVVIIRACITSHHIVTCGGIISAISRACTTAGRARALFPLRIREFYRTKAPSTICDWTFSQPAEDQEDAKSTDLINKVSSAEGQWKELNSNFPMTVCQGNL